MYHIENCSIYQIDIRIQVPQFLLEVHVVSGFHDECIGHVVVLYSRVHLDDVPSRATNVHIVDRAVTHP